MTDENPLEIEETSEEGNVLGPNDEIEVDGRIYTLSDIMQAKEQLESMSSGVESLRAFKESTNQLMSDNLGWDQKMQAARVVLSESGYTPEQIETYFVCKCYKEKWTEVLKMQLTPMVIFRYS